MQFLGQPCEFYLLIAWQSPWRYAVHARRAQQQFGVRWQRPGRQAHSTPRPSAAHRPCVPFHQALVLTSLVLPPPASSAVSDRQHARFGTRSATATSGCRAATRTPTTPSSSSPTSSPRCARAALPVGSMPVPSPLSPHLHPTGFAAAAAPPFRCCASSCVPCPQTV